MQEPDRFIGVLKHRVAPILYSVVTASFCLGSLMTTTQGFRSIFNFWFSLCLALGLQSAMLGASIFFAHNEAPQRRLPWLGVGMFAAMLSISFSYVGLRFDFEKVVLHIERPIRNRSDFLIQRDHLQEVAAQERGAALRSLDDQIAESDSRRGSADLSRVGRQIRAAEYRQEMSALIERIDHPPAAQSSTEATRLQQRLQTIKAQLAIVEGNSEILTLESLRQRSSLQQLRKLRKEVDDYAPDFQDVKDSDAAGKPDWSGLARQYDRLTRLMHEVPGESFQAALSSALPGPPAVKILSTDGQVMEGEGHPILSAFQHLARLEPLDLFFLALAASFDLIPLIFNWALGNQRSKGVSIPESLSAIGAWQRRTRGALQSMDGIVPFSTRAFWSVLFGRATRTGHAAVTEFEERLVLEQLEMDAKLKQLVMPDSLRQLIALEFAHLGTRVITIASERAAQFEGLVLDAYERCSVAIRSATDLDEETRQELTAFLANQVQMLTTAAVKYSTEAEVLTGIGVHCENGGNPATEAETGNMGPRPQESESGGIPASSTNHNHTEWRRPNVAHTTPGPAIWHRQEAGAD